MALGALATVVPGCVTGHLMHMARRWERARTFEQASVDGERLVVRYAAEISDDEGTSRGERVRRAAVDLGPLRGPSVPAEAVSVERVPDRGPLVGRAVTIVPVGEPARGPSPFLRIEQPADGRPALLVLGDEQQTFAPVPANAFTTTSTAGWVYPLVPFALCVDATSLPVLLFFAPGAIVIGD